MKIALLGYGKMGKEVENIALQRGHEIVIKSNGKKPYDINIADIAINFSVPDTAYDTIAECFNNNIPVISGTTGWLNNYKDIVMLCKQKDGAFIYASNFSLGATIFFELNNQLAVLMNSLEDYTLTLEEIHHLQKIDAPSGTAISLAEGIINNSNKTTWELNGNPSEENIPIHSKRERNITGTHSVNYSSEVDTIQIKHTAHSRKGFALGAVIAAEWLLNKKGVYSIKDVLNIG